MESKLKLGVRVEIIGKDAAGTVAYIGTTQFSTGKWVGVVLDEPKGKNNGTVQGKRYFACEDDRGIFVRPTQLKLFGEPDDSVLMSASTISESSVVSESDTTPGGKGEKMRRSGSNSSLNAAKQSPVKGQSAKPSPLAQATRPSLQRPAGRFSGSGSEKMATASAEHLRVPEAREKKVLTPAGASSPSLLTQAVPESLTNVKERRTSSSKVPHSDSGSSGVKAPSVLEKPGGLPSMTASSSILNAPGPTRTTPPAKPIPKPSAVVPSPLPTVIPVTTPSVLLAHSPDTELELSNLRSEIKTLTDQLEALKTKREDDRLRLQEFERAKIQLGQLEENRHLMREQAAELQRNLSQAKTEKAEVQEAFDRYREEMAEMVENMEMATLDKEMAEEKLDSLTSEVELLKEQIEELTLENQILKEESEDKGTSSTDGGPTPQQLKNLEQQNERMKQVLVKLRDLTNQDKQEITKLNKEVASLESEVSQLKTEKERLSSELKQSLEQTIELKDQVDAALGADQMVSQLTQRNLELEERCEKLTEERNDLEALCEMNDELQENSRDTERELREEIDQYRSQINQFVRHIDACKETLADYEKTLGKFRDLVTDLQAQNADLRRSLTEGKREPVAPVVSPDTVHVTDISPAAFGTAFGVASGAQPMIKMLETELRRMEAELMATHVTRLTAFLSDSFVRRGGDNDALLALILIDRLAAKTNLLATHLCERYPLPACVPGQVHLSAPLLTTASDADQQTAPQDLSEIRLPGSAQPLPPMTKIKAEFYSFITFLIYILRCWSALMVQFKQILTSCGVDVYLKFGSLYLDMAQQEQSLDRLLELAKKDQLDENTSLEPLMASFSYFIQLQSVHLSNERAIDCTSKLSDFVHCVSVGADALATNAMALMILTGQPLGPLTESAKAAAASLGGPIGFSVTVGEEPVVLAATSGGLLGLLVEVVRLSTVIRVTSRRIRRRLPKDNLTQPLCFSAEVSSSLDKALALYRDVVTIFRETTRKTGLLTARHTEDSTNVKPNTVFTECLREACKDTLTASLMADKSTLPDLCIRNFLNQVRDTISAVALSVENGEYDFDGTKQVKPQEPFSVRAASHKQFLADLEGCRGKLELKDEELRELQVTLKARASELSEMAVRVGLAEKRLEHAGKGNEEKISRLEQKIEQMEAQQKRDEREHGQTVNSLQADIDVLEQEKADLREKLKSLSKKALMEGLIKAPIVASASPVRQAFPAGSKDSDRDTLPVSPGRGLARDISFLTSEIEALREAVRHLNSENSKLRGEKMLHQMQSLKPLNRASRVRSTIVTEAPVSEGVPHTNQLSKVHRQLSDLQDRICGTMAHLKVVVLPSAEKIGPITSGAGDGSDQPKVRSPIPSASIQLIRQTAHLIDLKNELETLQLKTVEPVKQELPNAFASTVFGDFPSSKLKQALVCDSPTVGGNLVSRLIFPGSTDKSKTVKLALTPQKMRVLLTQLLSMT